METIKEVIVKQPSLLEKEKVEHKKKQIILDIIVRPGSKEDEVIEGTPLIVKLKAKAKEGKANTALIKLLSKHYKAEVRIISGLKSKKKKVIMLDR